MPTRVLDIGALLDSNQLLPDAVRVTETPHIQPDTPYAALSYCWGPRGNNLRTTLSNYAQMKQHIAFSRLPKTVQDAVRVTRSLGLRYLWVDALCIIQPDRPGAFSPDWAAEAGRMGEYYRHALYTIGASSAIDCGDGFLEDRPALQNPPMGVVEFTYPDKGSGRWGGTAMRHIYVGGPQPSQSACVDDSPLLRRGWCLQERALLRRCVYFARDCVVWECAELRAMEHEPLGDADAQSRVEWGTWKSHPMMKVARLPSVPREQLLGEAWMGMISQYSHAEFTFLPDKLVAISSLANKIGELTGARYVAGCWLESIDQCLAWYAEDTGSHPRRTCENYMVPSWSWAAVHYGVRFVSTDRNLWRGGPKLEDHTGDKLRLRGSMWRQSLGELSLQPFSEGGVTYIYRYGTRRPTTRFLYWDDRPPEQYDQSAILTFFLAGYDRLQLGAFALVETGRSDGGVKEYKRVAFLVRYCEELEILPGLVPCTIDLI